MSSFRRDNRGRIIIIKSSFSTKGYYYSVNSTETILIVVIDKNTSSETEFNLETPTNCTVGITERVPGVDNDVLLIHVINLSIDGTDIIIKLDDVEYILSPLIIKLQKLTLAELSPSNTANEIFSSVADIASSSYRKVSTTIIGEIIGIISSLR